VPPPVAAPIPDAQSAPATAPPLKPAAEDKAALSDLPPDLYPPPAAAPGSTGAAGGAWTSQQVFFAFGEPGWFEYNTVRTRALVLTETTVFDAVLILPAGDFSA
jgi:hypothetical protein